ncbi:unnamed protein product [Penicillium salamii]|nr:unnamed protein product [Penicillium salamii]
MEQEPISVSILPGLYLINAGVKHPSRPLDGGEIIGYDFFSKTRTLVRHQNIPDGIVFSRARSRLFWTNMGKPGERDGSITSCNTDGSDLKVIIPKGVVHTPKQITIDDPNGQLYFADREGMKIMRCDLDGLSVETLVQTGDCTDFEYIQDASRWCVGIAVSSRTNWIFWSQKGHSRGGTGQIFGLNLQEPRQPISLLHHLPEPIDLCLDDEADILYWTDRGELPFGNSLNKISVASLSSFSKPTSQYHIVCRNFHDPIGLVLDTSRSSMYVTDLGGTLYQCDLITGDKTVLFVDENCAFTGITGSRGRSISKGRAKL